MVTASVIAVVAVALVAAPVVTAIVFAIVATVITTVVATEIAAVISAVITPEIPPAIATIIAAEVAAEVAAVVTTVIPTEVAPAITAIVTTTSNEHGPLFAIAAVEITRAWRAVSACMPAFTVVTAILVIGLRRHLTLVIGPIQRMARDPDAQCHVILVGRHQQALTYQGGVMAARQREAHPHLLTTPVDLIGLGWCCAQELRIDQYGPHLSLGAEAADIQAEEGRHWQTFVTEDLLVKTLGLFT